MRLILIDPKRLELGVYEDIPHLLTPVVTDPKIASNVLKWAVGEMERRIRMLASEGVRNIEQFNNIIRAEKGARDEDAGEELKPLHYVVIVIDELADLMMVSSHEVEESITRLAQMARAVGIHLILATQRPSVDVITGLIKANFPSRISFRVAARVDSRTILDSIGAEQLLGRGDMLFLPPGSARLIRVHGAYVTEQEIARLTAFLRKQGQPAYDDTRRQAREVAPRRPRSTDRDELFDEAVALGGPERAGLDEHAAAPLPHRLLARGPADRHDGARRHHRPRRRLEAARDPGGEGLLRDGGQLAQVSAALRGTAERLRRRSGASALPCAVRRGAARSRVRAASRAARTASAARAAPPRRRPLPGGAGRRVAPARLRGGSREARRVGGGRPALPQGGRPLPPQRLLRQRPARDRRSVPGDGPALHARRRYREDALAAYRALVSEYPCSSLGDDALWSAIQIVAGRERPRQCRRGRPRLPRHLPRGPARAARSRRCCGSASPPPPLPSAPPPGPRQRLRPAGLERRLLDPRRRRRRAQGAARVRSHHEPGPAVDRPDGRAAAPEPRRARLPGRRRPARAGPHRQEPRRRRAHRARLQGRLGAPGLLPGEPDPPGDRRPRPGAGAGTAAARIAGGCPAGPVAAAARPVDPPPALAVPSAPPAGPALAARRRPAASRAGE